MSEHSSPRLPKSIKKKLILKKVQEIKKARVCIKKFIQEEIKNLAYLDYDLAKERSLF